MKRFLIFSICALLFLSGCTNAKIKGEQEKIYNGFKDSLLDNGELISANIPFDYHMNVEKNKGKYQYTILIDNPKVAMSNIQVMILNPEDIRKEIKTATIGIYDESIYNMVPNQTNEKSGYYKELQLKGVSTKKDFVVYATVAWKDNNQLAQYQVFFSFKVKNGKI